MFDIDLDSLQAIGKTIATALFTAGIVLVSLWNKLKVTRESVKEVKEQVTPNGGKSMADKINKVLAELLSYRQAIMDLMPEPMFKSKPNGQCTWVNIAYEDKFGISKDIAAGFGWLEVIHPDDRIRVKMEWLSAVHDQRVFDSNYRMRNRVTGVEFNIHGRAVPVVDDSGGIVSYIGMINIIGE